MIHLTGNINETGTIPTTSLVMPRVLEEMYVSFSTLSEHQKRLMLLSLLKRFGVRIKVFI